MDGVITTTIDFGSKSGLSGTGDILLPIILLLILAGLIAGIIAIKKKRAAIPLCVVICLLCFVGVAQALPNFKSPTCSDKVAASFQAGLTNIESGSISNPNEKSVLQITKVDLQSDAKVPDANWQVFADNNKLFEGKIGESKDVQFDLDVNSNQKIDFSVNHLNQDLKDQPIKCNFTYTVKKVSINGNVNLKQENKARPVVLSQQTATFTDQDGSQYTAKLNDKGDYTISGIPSGSTGYVSTSIIGFKDSISKSHTIDVSEPVTYSREIESVTKTGPYFDSYRLDELKLVANDLNSKKESSEFYAEFKEYMDKNQIWYSQSDGEEGNYNVDYKCHFDGASDKNQYLFLHIIDINNESGLTFQTVHALPVALKYGGGNDGWFPETDFGTYFGDAQCNICNLDTQFADAYKDKIVPTKKLCQRIHRWGSPVDDIQQVEANVFPLSYTEMVTPGQESFPGEYPWYFNAKEGKQYTWYKDHKIEGQTQLNDGTETLIWLRTPYHKTDNMFLYMDTDGSFNKENHYTNEYSICPAFNF